MVNNALTMFGGLYDIYKTQQTPPTGSHKNDYKSGTIELTGILKENKDKRNNEIKPLARIITKEVEQEINAFSKGFKGKKSFCCLILHKINNNLHKQMWKHRCIYKTAITNDLILEKTGDEVQEEVKTDRRKEVMERVNRKVDIWRDLFITYNTSPIHIETINAEIEQSD
ncbi:hypothetical protein C2G38_2143683 [Gigaspora rosea]|uniref:Uncharacterized protein n=1 Tax=Gigaspora rosea TaxID=44941 RepID=A0A397V053_9GLOM|nr:hypothetical protein C2G38_2143683 [Gigaspora rosea]